MAFELKPLFTWRGAVATADNGLTPTQRHIALTLSLHMNERGGSAFPSILTLAGETGLSNRTIIDGLRALESAGWIFLEHQGGGRGNPNRYRAVVPETVREVHGYSDDTPDGNSEPDTVETVNLTTVNSERGSLEDVSTEDVKRRGRKHSARARQKDEIWDTLVACFGAAPIDPRFRGTWNVAAKELRNQGATPEDIVYRVARYKAAWPDIACTPTALAKFWGRLGGEAPAARSVSKFEAARVERRMRNGQGTSRSKRGDDPVVAGLGDDAGNVRALDGGDDGAQGR